jgi:hypothetical protein
MNRVNLFLITVANLAFFSPQSVVAQTSMRHEETARGEVATFLFRRALDLEREAWRSLPPSPVLMTKAVFLALEGLRACRRGSERRSALYAQVRNRFEAYGYQIVGDQLFQADRGNLNLREYGPIDEWVREISRKRGVKALELDRVVHDVQNLKEELMTKATRGELNTPADPPSPSSRGPASIQAAALEGGELILQNKPQFDW